MRSDSSAPHIPLPAVSMDRLLTAGGRAALAFVLALLVALGPGLTSTVQAQRLDVPALTGRIVDQAELLDAAAEERIAARLTTLEQDTGAQVAVLTIPSLQGDVLEEFSIRVAREWRLGQAGRDNGALVLVARDDRQVRIEVGSGLEGALTDLITNRVIDERMVPRFRDGDFGGGIEAAVEAMDPIIRGEPMPAVVSEPLGPLAAAILVTGLVIVMSVLGLAAMAVGGAFAWLVYLVVMPLAYGVPTAAVNGTAGSSLFFLWALGFPTLYFTWGRRLRAASRKAWSQLDTGAAATSGKRSGRGPWGGSSGGGWGGGSSGGGWSGGGGGFSGGGASGRW